MMKWLSLVGILSVVSGAFMAVQPVMASTTGTGSSSACVATSTDPADCGNLTIHVTATGATAIWRYSPLVPGDQVFLVGVQGLHADDPSAPILTLASGIVTTPGLAEVSFTPPSLGWNATHPEAFEMHTVTDLESLPYGETPEVPYAAVLPATALLAVLGIGRRRRNLVK